MSAWHNFLTTDYGLLSAASILLMLGGLGYFIWYVTKHVREDCARHDMLIEHGASTGSAPTRSGTSP